VQSSQKTDDKTVATIFETSREKPIAALPGTAPQLDEHENARTRLRGNGATGSAGNPKRSEDSAETTRKRLHAARNKARTNEGNNLCA
jgi:hypothetical protein